MLNCAIKDCASYYYLYASKGLKKFYRELDVYWSLQETVETISKRSLVYDTETCNEAIINHQDMRYVKRYQNQRESFYCCFKFLFIIIHISAVCRFFSTMFGLLWQFIGIGFNTSFWANKSKCFCWNIAEQHQGKDSHINMSCIRLGRKSKYCTPWF